MLSVQSLVTNHWALLDRKNEKEFHTTKLSPKEECLLDLIDGDYRGEKCIIYTRFRSFIDRLQWLTENGYFTSRKFLRITGAENEKQRADAKRKFQDPDSGYDLLFCNDAALEGVNLQSANHLITMDLPWSWGNLLQLIGRMCRMASRHAANTFHIIVAKGTIDEYVIDTLKNKRGVFSKILGESASAGILDNGEILNLGSGMEDVKGEEEFKSLLKAFIKSVPMSKFLEGEMLESAQEEGDQYQMTFEKSPKKKRKQKSLKDEIGKHCDEIELL
jgi:SNF2 family DNA or RNA helicase